MLCMVSEDWFEFVIANLWIALNYMKPMRRCLKHRKPHNFYRWS